MPQDKKDAVLLIGRGILFTSYIQGMINEYSKHYTVLVVDNPSMEYTGDYIRIENDYYRQNVSFSDSDVKNAEEELGINAIYSYSNYLYYGRLAQEANIDHSSYWLSKEKITNDFYSSYIYFKQIFDEYNIVFAFHDTIDQVYSFVLEAFSQKMGFGFYHTYIIPGIFNNRLLNGTTQQIINPQFKYELLFGEPPSNEENNFIEEIMASFSKEKPTMDYMKVRPTSLFNRYEVTSLIKNFSNIKYAVKRVRNRMYLQKKCKDFDLGSAGKYILFFFSHQPESVTTSAAQQYADQWKIVEELAIHAPSDINIVIKDHPFGFGWRGKDYFERLIRLPNVHMAPVNYPSKELIQNAQAVLTINGSVGLEALMYGVKSYSLGNAWYSHPEFIPNLSCPVEVYSRLSEPKLTEEQRKRILLASYRSSVDFKVEYQPTITREKIESGERMAAHMVANKNIYFNRYENITDMVYGNQAD